MKLLFYCSYASTAMAFLTSRNVSKYILYALGVNCTTRGAVKAGLLTTSPASQCRARLDPFMFPRYTSL